MSSNKAALKAAKAAFDSSQYDEAISQTKSVLESDKDNYNARLLLGRAQEKKQLYDDAEATYRTATALKPDDFQAWSGLCSAYAAQGGKNVDAYIDAASKLAQIHADAEDNERCQNVIDKLVDFVRRDGKPHQIRSALSLMLPTNPLYGALEGRVPHPSHTYTRIAESLEADEKQKINAEIAQRRTRIGAKVGQVTLDVKRELLGNSQLDDVYRQIINWSSDDEIRHSYEEKLLEHCYELLTVLPVESKASKLDEVLTMAEGMVIIHHPFRLAWDLVLETRDLDSLQDMDINVLQEYMSFFPNAGMSRVLEAWLSSDLSPFKLEKEAAEEDKPLTPEDRLLMIADGVARSSTSTLASRLAGEYYLSLDEFESAVQTARAGLKILQTESVKLGLSLQNTKDALNSTLGTALVVVQAPRNHPDARQIFDEILQRKPKFTPALIGLGLILEETQDYKEAIAFLERGLQQDPSNVRIAVEAAWCRALDHDFAAAQQELETYLPQLTTDNPKSRALRAQCLYRIGICIWELDDSKAARKDRAGAYAYFLNAIKTDVEFAPAYTSLGLYYEQYAKDKKRARQCFQKAFELSPAETDAAERLARSFANQGDWEVVEVIAQRVIDSGRARPPPGSKRKALSWPYSALGVAQMNKLDYQQAIVSFLAALRISPNDYQAYVGLGESYHNSGRYNSASRTLNHALDLQTLGEGALNETWFARYMLANVHRELGEHDEAVAGLEFVLEERPDEFGVLLSLLQTYNEKAWRSIETALFGQAIEAATSAITIAARTAKLRPNAFNMWKGVGDACMTFSWVQNAIERFPLSEIVTMLGNATEEETYSALADIDMIDQHSVATSESGSSTSPSTAIHASILAYKRGIFSCSTDIHAQAVAWYNLGWAEHRAYTCSELKAGKKFLKAATRCFKRAIELEAGNGEFWNALGVVTTTLNPRVAQHAFVRSLHINELNAKVWTNLGVLYFLQNDYELAEQAFGRAQSTDPEYAHGWVGAGLISLMTGNQKRALNDFTHAFEIADSASLITKQQYTMSAFDHLLATPTTSNDLTTLIQPLFALEQLYMQSPKQLTFRHLAALFLERVGSFTEAIDILSALCTTAEAEYEASESLTALAHFAHAKADLARCQLAAQSFAQAAENAETALDLSAESGGLDPEIRLKLRLSAHLTAGLAFSSLQKSTEAINMFRSALDESGNDPDVTCVLVKMLWAHGGQAERGAARDQLFECVERYPEHAGSLTLLGTIAALDGDADTLSAVRDDLINLRTSDKLGMDGKEEIEILLSSLAVLDGSDGDADLREAQVAAMLQPSDALAWSELAEISGEQFPAHLALVTTAKAVPPSGSKIAEDLGRAFAMTGTAGDAQRAVSLMPWSSEGWNALQSAVGM